MQVTTGSIERFHNSDPTIMEAIYREHENAVFRRAYRIIKVKEDAKDITQIVFTRLWCKRKQFKSESDIHAFLFVHTKWAANDFVKKGKTKATHHHKIALQHTGNNYETPAVFTKMDIEYAMKIIIPAFRQLEPRCQQVLKMYYVDKITYENIALRLNLEKKTVQTIRSKGVSELKKIVDETGTRVNFYSFLPIVILLAQGIPGSF